MKGVKMQQSTNKIDHVRNLVDHETRGSDSLPEVNPDIKVNKPIEKYVHPHGRGNVNLQNKGFISNINISIFSFYSLFYFELIKFFK